MNYNGYFQQYLYNPIFDIGDEHPCPITELMLYGRDKKIILYNTYETYDNRLDKQKYSYVLIKF